MTKILTKNFSLEETPSQNIKITYRPAEKVMNLNLNGLDKEGEIRARRVASSDPLDVWPTDEVNFISPNAKIKLYNTSSLIHKIGKLDSDYFSLADRKHDSIELLSRNLETNKNKIYNQVISRFGDNHELKPVLRELGSVTPVVELNPKDWAESLLAYRWKPGNEDFLVRKSRVTESPRQLKRNLEANLGMHILRSDEFEQYVGLIMQMYRGEGYPATARKSGLINKIRHNFNPESQNLASIDDIIEVVNEGEIRDGIYTWRRPESNFNDFGEIETEYDFALTLSRYNRPNGRVENKVKQLAKKHLGTRTVNRKNMVDAFNLARKEIESNKVKQLAKRVKVKRKL